MLGTDYSLYAIGNFLIKYGFREEKLNFILTIIGDEKLKEMSKIYPQSHVYIADTGPSIKNYALNSNFNNNKSSNPLPIVPGQLDNDTNRGSISRRHTLQPYQGMFDEEEEHLKKMEEEKKKRLLQTQGPYQPDRKSIFCFLK